MAATESSPMLSGKSSARSRQSIIATIDIQGTDMTQEQIHKLHELENERHYLNLNRMNNIIGSLADNINVNGMEWMKAQDFILKYISKVHDVELLREIVDKILHHFFYYNEYVQKRLEEIEKEIEEL